MRHIISLFRFFLICSAKNYVFIIFEFDLCHSHFINIQANIHIHIFRHSYIHLHSNRFHLCAFFHFPFSFCDSLVSCHTPTVQLSLSLSHPSTRLACSLYVLMPRRHTIIIHNIHIHYALDPSLFCLPHRTFVVSVKTRTDSLSRAVKP